ncbi:hypothetical protein CFP65_7023 [Kitasatospora sp. MMS16-BH015]|uniref:hypothetical protein n=1 Tax=Kitasatospora sp. MMS16-BH015 TaxID=2018025 RepID=UPI000CA25E1B|nr:hypothetical protein [Kitasatospora sp. MMS16-BH015]AUG81630.1 hypothetical protein CFP65_7023 [Kitasatospora sp. MMS16-BH015]
MTTAATTAVTTSPASAEAAGPGPDARGSARPPVALLGRVPGRRLAPVALRAALAALATAPDRAAAEREVAGAHREALRQERAALRAALRGDAFRSPATAGATDPVSRYLAATEPPADSASLAEVGEGGGPSATDLATLEAAALEHLTRAMLRLGPPTAHTAVAPARWAEDGVPLDRPGLDPEAGRTSFSPDRPMLAMAVDALLADAPGAPETDGLPALLRANWTLRMLHSQARFYRRDGEQLRLVGTALTRKVRALLGLVEPGPLPSEVLVRELSAALDLPPAAATELITEALRLQLLVSAADFDLDTDQPAATTAAHLATSHPEAAALLTTIQHRLDTATTGGELQAETLAGLAEDQRALNALLSHPVSLRLTEEHVLPQVAVAAGPHRPALDDLAQVLEYTALADRLHDARALLVTAFTERFGAGARVRLADCAADLVTVVARRIQLLTPATSADFGPADGSLGELLRLRAAARARLGELITAGSAEVALDPAELASLAAQLPDRFRRTAASYTVLVRPLGDRLTVLGHYPGDGSFTPRPVAAHRKALDPVGWLGLTLAHDPATDTLGLLDPSGAPARPQLPSTTRPEQLAPVQRIALWLHGTSRLRHDPLAEAAADRAGTWSDSGTLALPRLTAGRVVLQGRRWYPGADLPGGSGPELLCALADWRAAHGVPEELLLVEPARPEAELDAVLGTAAAPDRTRYLDLASALSAETLRSLPAGSHLAETPAAVRDGEHALDWLLEYDRAPGEQFRNGGRL